MTLPLTLRTDTDQRRFEPIERAIIIAENLHNLGDLALLLQCASGIEQHLGVKHLFVRQWNDPPAEVVRQLDDARISVLPGKRVLRTVGTIRRSLLVMSGGQVARDNGGLAAMVNMAILVRLARLAGGRLAILACGFSHLKRRRHRVIWRRILRAATLVTVRDIASGAEVRQLCPQAAPIVTADLMFMPSPLHAKLLARAGAPHVVIAPCVDTSEGRSIDPARLAAVAAQACRVAGVARVCLVAQDARPGMDMRIIPAIAEALHALHPELAVAIVAGYRLDDVLRAYAASALTITNRLHPAIFSLIAERPVLVVDDRTPKLEMMARRFGLDRISTQADHIPDEIIGRLRGQFEHGQPSSRVRLLAEAKAAATANFAMLAHALGAVTLPERSDRRGEPGLHAAA